MKINLSNRIMLLVAAIVLAIAVLVSTVAMSLSTSIITEHVETVVPLSHKKADTYINVNVEFGDEYGQIPIDEIAR